MAAAISHMKMQLNPQQLLIRKIKLRRTMLSATTPGNVKIDVDTIVPTPNARKSLTRKYVLNVHLYFDR